MRLGRGLGLGRPLQRGRRVVAVQVTGSPDLRCAARTFAVTPQTFAATPIGT
jgi:hypothetical protein